MYLANQFYLFFWEQMNPNLLNPFALGTAKGLTLLNSERSKPYGVLPVLNTIGLSTGQQITINFLFVPNEKLMVIRYTNIKS